MSRRDEEGTDLSLFSFIVLCTIPGTWLTFNSVGCSKSVREEREKRTSLKKKKERKKKEDR